MSERFTYLGAATMKAEGQATKYDPAGPDVESSSGNRDRIKFSSGREIYANCGIIGIDAGLSISEGYDGGIAWPSHDWGEPLTKDDMRELADMLIDRWQRFKETLA